MAEKIPARFRKTKTDKWAVMAPVEVLEKALAEDGKVDVLKKSGDWTTFRVGSLGRPFDVDGVQMCYGYSPEDSDEADGGAPSGEGAGGGAAPRARSGGAPRSPRSHAAPPPVDRSEPMPEYQGGAEDEWVEGF